MRASRLVAMLMSLQRRGRSTAESLAREFEVSIRTVYRDIDALSAAGVPVYGDRGPNGGFKLHDGYRTNLTGMSRDEARGVLLAGLPGPAADLGLAGAAATARLKLLAAITPESGAAASRVGDRLHFDPADWYQRKAAPAHLPALAHAVWSERRIRFRYASWRATVTRTADPLGLVLKAGAWYLVARVRQQVRTYKVAGVTRLRVLDRTFAPPRDFDLARHWNGEVLRFERSLHRHVATLRAAPAAMSRLDRLGAAIAEPLRAARPAPDGRRAADVPIESIDHAAGLLLGFGADIEVVSPASLRAALAERAARVIALYRSDRHAGRKPPRDALDGGAS